MPARIKITDPEILAKHTAALDGWRVDGDTIKRDIEFKDFLTAVEFIQKLAPHAEELDHHPELFNVYNRVSILLTTHDADGLTEYDFVLAAKLDDVASALLG